MREKAEITTEASRRRAISIAEFCAEIGITTRTYYNNRHDMPDAIRAGRRLLILRRSIDEWECEQIAAAKAEKSTACGSA